MIRRLELHNFATHQDTEVEFGSGKNVFIGPTGSGKTNLLQALDFAFTGEVPQANLAELVADDADTAEVILDYVEPRTGQNYRIHRTLTRDADGKVVHECSLTNLDNNETVKKPAPVQRTLETLGVDSSVFRHVVHIAQGSFSQVLEETQERKNTMDRLLQISQLEGAYQEMGRQGGPINQLELRKHRNLEKISGLQMLAATLDSEKVILERIVEERERKQSMLEESKKERDRLEKTSEKNLETLSSLQNIEEKIMFAKSTLAASSDQVRTLVSKLYSLLPQETCKDIEKQTFTEMASYLDTLKSNLNNLQKEHSHLNDAHRNALQKAAEIQSQISLLEEDKRKTSNHLVEIQNYLGGKGEEPQIECDKCGSILTKEQWSGHIKERNETLQNLDSAILELLDKYEEHKALVNSRQKSIEEVNSSTKKYENAILLVEQLITQRQGLEQSFVSKKQFEVEKVKLANELRILLQSEPTATDKEVVDQAHNLRHRIEALRKQVGDLENELQRYDKNHLEPQKKRVADAEEASNQLKRLDPEIQLDEKKISLLQTIRAALREIQPIVRKNFTTRISKSANDYLSKLYGGSEIENFEFNEDYEFFVTRAGYRRHANRLSGGQQVLASMAFLLALSEVLSQLDFLILDEPTTHLDTNRRIELVAVLENLRRVPQLIIVDHHPELFDAADTCFQISLSPQGHSQLCQQS